MLPLEITVAETKPLLEKGEILLIDCREPQEREIAAIEAARLIPLGDLADRLAELPEAKDARLVVHCHHGGRSLRAASFLRQAGYENAQSLAGGIDQWAVEVEPGMARY